MLWQRLPPADSVSRTLVRDALNIWQAGVTAVQPDTLLRNKIHRDGRWLCIDEDCRVDLSQTRRLIIVGAGKASAAMASRFRRLAEQEWATPDFPPLLGWINTPAGTGHEAVPDIQFHVARPVGSNLPTHSALEGTQRILNLVSTAHPDDVVLCMISGGGSALLVAPQPGITLADKQAVAELVSAAGGNIRQLNTIRSCLSRVKGGGLARQCRAGRMIALIISDVLGDPLDIIASGPTVLDNSGSYRRAVVELEQLDLLEHPQLHSVVQWLRAAEQGRQADPRQNQSPSGSGPPPKIDNIILGNISDAVDAAGVRAVELGYQYLMQTARQPEGDVRDVALMACSAMERLAQQAPPDCWISGGEPTVKLPADNPGKGGRNQQLALAVLELLSKRGWPEVWPDNHLVFLSGGTDGEDGPTDAAGAWISAETLQSMRRLSCSPLPYLDRADAYHFFERMGGLIVSGPTGTNVGDLRIALSRKGSA
ncbi:MAG: DUF4147 domain-containing protein [Pirellulaceae bacterium]|nr:DUF4147 domain-containing protein [Pirellulaceae bacterium]